MRRALIGIILFSMAAVLPASLRAAQADPFKGDIPGKAVGVFVEIDKCYRQTNEIFVDYMGVPGELCVQALFVDVSHSLKRPVYVQGIPTSGWRSAMIIPREDGGHGVTVYYYMNKRDINPEETEDIYVYLLFELDPEGNLKDGFRVWAGHDYVGYSQIHHNVPFKEVKKVPARKKEEK